MFNNAKQKQRIEVFEDTISWIQEDKYLSSAVDDAKKKTEVFYEDEYPEDVKAKKVKTVVKVTENRSFQAAMNLHRDEPDSKIAVMNFANAFKAGGGVEHGASAQEECLCRTSTLYPVIYRKSLRDSFYAHHKKLNTYKASDSLIYSEGIVICKTDTDVPERMDKEDWISVDVITIAAPDLRSSSNKYFGIVGNGGGMSDAELFGYHVKRAIHMLSVAKYKGADTLVLGAFGCGAFQNNPEVVAKAYRVALDQFEGVFKRIEFAVYCPPGNNDNYKAFYNEFKKYH